jgi:hypothetical protein
MIEHKGNIYKNCEKYKARPMCRDVYSATQTRGQMRAVLLRACAMGTAKERGTYATMQKYYDLFPQKRKHLCENTQRRKVCLFNNYFPKQY